MSRKLIARYVTPWVSKREKEEQQRVAALRQRDGDKCRRCRRPIRFDLPSGNDKGPRIESILAPGSDGAAPIDSLCLCHGRCNADSGDNTQEVTERVRRRSEAALFARSRKRARA
jgi:hypothetical protein